MAKKINYYGQVIKILQELKKAYPNQNLGKHLASSLSEYGDVWGLSDSELYFALDKYKNELAMDRYQLTDEEELNRIIEEGKHLDRLQMRGDTLIDLDEEEEDI